MRHFIRILQIALLGLFLSSTVAWAENEASSLKIGVFDWQVLSTKAPQAEEAYKRLEEEFKAKKDKLLNKQKDYLAKQEKMHRDRDVMSDPERAKSEKDLMKVQQELRQMDEEFNSERAERQREEQLDFIKVVREAVEKLAEDEKYDLILPQETTVYWGDRVDVTDKILQRLVKAKQTGKSDKKAENKSSKK